MPRTKPACSPAFRAETVSLLWTSKKPVPEIARELGASDQTLRNWLH